MTSAGERKRKHQEDNNTLIASASTSDDIEPSLTQVHKRARIDVDWSDHVPLYPEALESTANCHTLKTIDNKGSIASDQPTSATAIAGTTLSGRAKKRAAIGDKVGSNDKPKGNVRKFYDGSLEYFFEKEDKWIPAVTHDEIRGALIDEYNSQGQYDQARARGLGETDVTCFYAPQKSWGDDPLRRPQALRQIFPTPKPITGKAQFWYRDGKIVLDPDDRPVRLLDIPAVCSSRMEDWLMTAMVLSDIQIEILDIRARMPRTITVTEKGKQVQRSLFCPNALSMRMTRYRTKHGIMPRESRGGSGKKEEKLKAFLGEDRVKKNSLAGFEPLTKDQIVEVEAVNKGNFSYRARTENRSGKRKEMCSEVGKLPRKRVKASRTEKPVVHSTMAELGQTSSTQEAQNFPTRLDEYAAEQVLGVRSQAPDEIFQHNHIDEYGFLSNMDPFILTGENNFGMTTDQPLSFENHPSGLQTQKYPIKSLQYSSSTTGNESLAIVEPSASSMIEPGLGEGYFAEAFRKDEDTAQYEDVDLLESAQRYLAGLPLLPTANAIVSRYPDRDLEADVQQYLAGLAPSSTKNTEMGGDVNDDAVACWNGGEPDSSLCPVSPLIVERAESEHLWNKRHLSDPHYCETDLQDHITIASAPDQQASTNSPGTDSSGADSFGTKSSSTKSPGTDGFGLDSLRPEAIGTVIENSVGANGWAADEFLGIGDLLFKYAPRPLFDFDSI